MMQNMVRGVAGRRMVMIWFLIMTGTLMERRKWLRIGMTLSGVK